MSAEIKKRIKAAVLDFISLTASISKPIFEGISRRPCLQNWCDTFTFDDTAEKSTQFIDAARKAMQDAAPALVAEIKVLLI